MRLLNYKTIAILLALLVGIFTLPRQELLMADSSSTDTVNNASNLANSILGGLAEVSTDTIESYKFCQKNPDAIECEQRRLASIRNVESSMQMLEVMNKSGALATTGMHQRDNFQSELEELREINQMCTQEPNSFVCSLVRDLVGSKINKRNKKVFVHGIANKDY